VTQAELAVLQSLWEKGPCNIRKLTDELYPDGTVSHYATVKKLLERLEAKGHVRRDRSLAVHVFEATTERDHLIGHRLRAVAASLCNGLMTPLLMHLVGSERLTDEELQSLRSMLDAIEKSPKRKWI
jgi:predicted transcriptional regulator